MSMKNLRTSTPTARKAHHCDWCHAQIRPGTQYHRSTNISDDHLYDWVACVECEALFGEVWDWASTPEEGVGDDSYDEWARDHRDDERHGESARAYLARRLGGDA